MSIIPDKSFKDNYFFGLKLWARLPLKDVVIVNTSPRWEPGVCAIFVSRVWFLTLFLRRDRRTHLESYFTEKFLVHAIIYDEKTAICCTFLCRYLVAERVLY